jgi:hypothetical protein
MNEPVGSDAFLQPWGDNGVCSIRDVRRGQMRAAPQAHEVNPVHAVPSSGE